MEARYPGVERDGVVFDRGARKERQEEREMGQVEAGTRRHTNAVERAREKGQAYEKGATTVLTRKISEGLVARYSEEALRLAEESARKTGPDAAYLALLKRVGEYESKRGRRESIVEGASQVAHIVASLVMSSLHAEPKLASLGRKVVREIDSFLRLAKYEKEFPHLKAARIRQAKKAAWSGDWGHMSRVLSTGANSVNIGSQLDLTPSLTLSVGQTLVQLFCECTWSDVHQQLGVYWALEGDQAYPEVFPRDVRKERPYRLYMTDWFADDFDRIEALIAAHKPRRSPMIYPPNRWGPDQRGGYLTDHITKREPLIRGWTFKEHSEKVEKMDLPLVAGAVNRLSETPYEVNAEIAGLMRLAYEREWDLPAIPDQPLSDPPVPFDIESNARAKEEYKRAKHAVRTENARRRLERGPFLLALNAAESILNDGGPCWYPHSLDSRGRMYPSVDVLSPQGDDVQRALLTFAAAEPLGPHGIIDLAITGANLRDEEKDTGWKANRLSYDERVEWVKRNEENIFASADDPFTNRWWTEGEKKSAWQFLAWCIEWTRFKRSGEGEDFVSGLPCHRDGVCDGTQHFAGAMRDGDTAQKVCMTPEDRPRDFYLMVLEAVLERLHSDWSAESNPYAEAWLKSGLVTRGLVKLPVMTWGYGSGVVGWVDQLAKEVTKGAEAEVYETLKVHVEGTEQLYPDRALYVLAKACAIVDTRKKDRDRERVAEQLEIWAEEGDPYSQIWLASGLVSAKLVRRGIDEKRGRADVVRLKEFLASEGILEEVEGMFSVEFDGTHEHGLRRVCRYLANVIDDSISTVTQLPYEGREFLQKWATLLSRHVGQISWTVPVTGFLVLQKYQLMKSKTADYTWRGVRYQPGYQVATSKPDHVKHRNSIAPNVVHSWDSACLMMTIDLAAAAGVTSFLAVHDSYATVAGHVHRLDRATRQAFYNFHARDPLRRLHEEWSAMLPEGVEPPEFPKKGDYDLGQVLAAAYFVN